MSSNDAVRKVKKMFAGFGKAPSPDEVVGNLKLEEARPVGRPRGEPTVQLNLRVPPTLKRRVRVLAARDNISLSDVVVRAIALYEEKHGAAPEF